MIWEIASLVWTASWVYSIYRSENKITLDLTVDEDIIQKINDVQKSSKLDFNLNIGEKTFPIKHVSIIKSTTPVNRPIKRGGVYFSDTFVFKIKARITDQSIAPLLSKSMLGPNTDFENLEIITHIDIDNSLKKIILHTHLTNCMQNSSFIELNLTLIKIESK